MSVVGTVESLWRYPVKSMRGEELDEAFVGFNFFGAAINLSELIVSARDRTSKLPFD